MRCAVRRVYSVLVASLLWSPAYAVDLVPDPMLDCRLVKVERQAKPKLVPPFLLIKAKPRAASPPKLAASAPAPKKHHHKAKAKAPVPDEYQWVCPPSTPTPGLTASLGGGPAPGVPAPSPPAAAPPAAAAPAPCECFSEPTLVVWIEGGDAPPPFIFTEGGYTPGIPPPYSPPYSPTPSIPEPREWMLMLLGLSAVAWRKHHG